MEDPNLNKFLISATKLHTSPLNMEFMVIPGKKIEEKDISV